MLMLRRYCSNGLQSIPLPKAATTIGSSDCDIVIPDDRLASQHAIIEFNPISKTYWLKDAGTLAGTICNGEPIYNKAQLKSGDVIRFGYGPEFVFEMNSAPILMKKRTHKCSACDSTLSLPVVGRRMFPPPMARRESLSIDESPPPIVQQARRKVRIEQNPSNTTDGQRKLPPKPNIRPISGLIHRRKSKQTLTPEKPKLSDSVENVEATSEAPQFNATSPSDSSSNPGEMPDIDELMKKRSSYNRERPLNNISSCESTNENLLQKVVQLQVELLKRDSEVAFLKKAIMSNCLPNKCNASIDSSYNLRGSFRNQRIMQLERSPLRAMKSNASLDLDIYRTFIEVVRYELTSLNHKVSTYPMRDYAEIFNAIVNSLQEPFSYKLMDIEEKCKEMLESKGYNEQQFERLHELIVEPKNEQIQPIIRQLEQILPVIREAATIARESVRVCAVFTAWSRELGDLIRTDGLNSEMLMQYADELHVRFGERLLSKHWLPPSLTPLLRVSAIALRQRLEEKLFQKSTSAVNTDLTLVEMEKLETELNTLRTFKTEQELDLHKVASAEEREPMSRTSEYREGRSSIINVDVNMEDILAVGNAQELSSNKIIHTAETNEKIELNDLDGNFVSKDNDRSSLARNNAYNQTAMEIVDSERIELEDHNERIDESDYEKRDNRTKRSVQMVSAGAIGVDMQDVANEAELISSIGSQSNEKQQPETDHSKPVPESSDNDRLSSEVINTLTGKSTSAENSAESHYVKEIELLDSENATSKATNIISASKVVPDEEPLHTANINTTEEGPSIRKDMSVCSATNSEGNACDYAVPHTSEEIATLNSALNRSNYSITGTEETTEQPETKMNDSKLGSDDRDSIAARDSDDIARRQMSNNKFDSSVLRLAINANEFGDSISVDRTRSSDNIRNSAINSVYSSNLETDGELNSSNEFVDDASNISNSPTIHGDEIKRIPEKEDSQQISDNEAESTPNTARRIVKSFDSTNVDDRKNSSNRMDENSSHRIEETIKQNNKNTRNINNENTNTKKFNSESYNENSTDSEGPTQATIDEDNEYNKHHSITSSEAPSEKMDPKLIHPQSDDHSLINIEQCQQKPFEKEINLNFPIDNNVSKVIDIGDKENANRKTSITSRNEERILEEEKIVEKFADTTASGDENCEQTESMKDKKLVNDVESPSSSCLHEHDKLEKSVKSIEEDSLNGNDKDSTGKVRDTEQQLDVLVENISKFLGIHTASNRNLKGITTEPSDTAIRDQRIDEVLSRIGQLRDNNVFCETCHRM